MSKQVKEARPVNWLLIRIRAAHGWGGLSIALFLMIIGLTGIWLNHIRYFEDLLGLKKTETMRPSTQTLLTTETDLATTILPAQRALAIAKERMGTMNVMWVLLREEQGKLIYRVRKQDESGEVTIHAATGEVLMIRDKSNETKVLKDGTTTSTFNWTRFFLDLHTGRIAGDGGKLFVDGVAILACLLGFTGIYLWSVPRYRKWRKRRLCQTPTCLAAGITQL